MITITAECNDLKCRHQWELSIEKERVNGNRVIGLVSCPKCYRMDAPYIITEEVEGHAK